MESSSGIHRIARIGSDPDDFTSSEVNRPAFGLVGRSRALAHVRAVIERFGPTRAPVLIAGETGTGKELVARAVHAVSPRAHKPYVTANAATFTNNLLGSELFGHARGAFTGAVGVHRGLFEQAHGGTLLLDEVGELDLAAQAQLLRVLETGEVRAVGGELTRKVDVRLIAATHRDLARMVHDGGFREDLYYRLDVLTIRIPPLRQRLDDLSPLAAHILVTLRDEVGEKALAPEAITALEGYGWPGNVRELVNVLRRAAHQTDSKTLDADAIRFAIRPTTLPKSPVSLPTGGVVSATGEISPATIEQALRSEGGRVAATARRLGIARSTLRDAIHRHGIRVHSAL